MVQLENYLEDGHLSSNNENENGKANHFITNLADTKEAIDIDGFSLNNAFTPSPLIQTNNCLIKLDLKSLYAR